MRMIINKLRNTNSSVIDNISNKAVKELHLLLKLLTNRYWHAIFKSYKLAKLLIVKLQNCIN